MIDFSDGALRHEQDVCRRELDAARGRYAQEKTPESREEYLRVLKRFADLSMNLP